MAAYLVLAPIVVVIGSALGVIGWGLRRRSAPVGVRSSATRGSHRLSD